jgi:hypothetical protein
MSKARHEFIKANKMDLTNNQRVFFKDGNPHNFDKDNLTYVTFSGVSYKIAKSKVVYKPNVKPNLKRYQPKIRVFA